MANEDNGVTDDNLDVDNIIEERERLDRMFQDKFTKVITVMFTDLKGSTTIAENQGDFATRTMIKQHNDIVFPAIKKQSGVLVKTMGDGTMSYFTNAQDAVRSAVMIKAGIDELNLKKTLPSPILIRIGIHTGKGIVEQNDIFGDVVNVASRFESNANPGEIYLSEDTYNSLTDKTEIYCRFIKTTTLKGKKEPFNIYKAFWDPKEIELDMTAKPTVQQAIKKTGLSPVAKILFIAIPLLIILFIILEEFGVFKSGSPDETRTKQHSITIPADPSR
ncbi:MAG: adenylate/guanylate cyclase domain-containing protein [Nitrospirae bacterium]|nr:adenylate/guanylate cyclase domain-containing protein [Nitrospirota bacterium]